MIYPDIPVKALSIMQPWAWLIVNGQKDIENRYWKTNYRGPVAIHAGKKIDKDCAWDLSERVHPVTGLHKIFFGKETGPAPWDDETGGIIGVVDIVDCVMSSESDWFFNSVSGKGKPNVGFILRNARPVEFIPVKGALGFFDWRKNL